MKKSIKFLSIILTALVVLSSFAVVSFAVETDKTTTGYRYESRFNFARILYNDFSLVTEEYFAIPGLENTLLSGDKSCTAMTPQGLTVSEDFIFISAYCGVKKYKTELEENISYGKNAEKLEKEKNHEVHNSVIYILDRETGDYLKTLVLPDSNHVGGLATDGKNLFIAKSSDKQISVISGTQINLALQTKSLTVKAAYEYSVDCECAASFVTWFDDVLWVGVFGEKNNGELRGFSFNGIFGLEEIVSAEIPAKANGACFAKLGDKICLAVNTSYGRKNPSKIYLYSVSDYGTSAMTLSEKDTYTTPPTVQNSCVYDGKVYYIYESAATCYSQVDSLFEIKSTTCPVDRVCIGKAENLFNWHCENLFLERVSAFVRAIKVVAENIF